MRPHICCLVLFYYISMFAVILPPFNLCLWRCFISNSPLKFMLNVRVMIFLFSKKWVRLRPFPSCSTVYILNIYLYEKKKLLLDKIAVKSSNFFFWKVVDNLFLQCVGYLILRQKLLRKFLDLICSIFFSYCYSCIMRN